MADDGEVVSHEQVGQAERRLQLVEQIDHAGLDGDVQRRHRLVEHDQPWLQGQRPGDADALPLAAGELLGVAARERRLQTDQAEQLVDPLLDLGLGVYLNTPIGSAIRSKTGIRGSREAIGSWKTTCRSRRICLRSRRSSVPTSRPRTTTSPPVGGLRFRISSSVVLLPQPDSPDQTEGLALLDLQVDAVDRVDGADPATEDRALHQRVVALHVVAARARSRAASRGMRSIGEAGIAGIGKMSW